MTGCCSLLPWDEEILGGQHAFSEPSGTAGTHSGYSSDVGNRRPAVVEVLLDAGADPGARNPVGDTPADIAKKRVPPRCGICRRLLDEPRSAAVTRLEEKHACSPASLRGDPASEVDQRRRVRSCVQKIHHAAVSWISRNFRQIKRGPREKFRRRRSNATGKFPGGVADH